MKTWNYASKGWLYNTSEIVPESFAVLNNNFTVFYGIHGVGIILQIISLTCCSLVVLFIISSRLKKHSWDFSDRFPLSLALLDLTWGPVYLIDAFLIISRQTFPADGTCTAMGIFLWVAYGYQQIMNIGLVVYMYLRVVRQKRINLGYGEWKLHAVEIIMIVLCVAIFHPLGSFGCSGYWYLNKNNTTSGIILGYYMCISTSVQAFCSSMGYRSIRNIIEVQKKSLSELGIHSVQTVSGKFRHHSIATQCLTTFVRISEILYCTLAIAAWAFMLQVTFGVQEPTTILVMIATANSSGWANALGYFYNRRVKAKKSLKPHKHLPTVSAFLSGP